MSLPTLCASRHAAPPVPVGARSALALPGRTPTVTQRRRPRILVADDDPDTLESVRMVLGMEGYEVAGAHSLVEELQVLDRESFDVVLTDLFDQAPATPLQSAARVCQHARTARVVVMTAWRVNPGDAAALGVCACLAKPFDLDVLVITVARALGRGN